MEDKIIVTNRAALTAKYGAAGVAKIDAAVGGLVASDARRGIQSPAHLSRSASRHEKFPR